MIETYMTEPFCCDLEKDGVLTADPIDNNYLNKIRNVSIEDVDEAMSEHSKYNSLLE